MIDIMNDGILGPPLRSIPAGDIPPGSLWEDIALENPDSMIQGVVLSQTGSVYFGEDGSYETPATTVIVLVRIVLDGLFYENRQYTIGTAPPIASTGRKTYMSAGV